MSINWDPSKDWDSYCNEQDKALAAEAAIRRTLGDRVTQLTCSLLRVYGMPAIIQTDDSILAATYKGELIVDLAVKIATKIHFECEGFADGL